MLILGLDIGTSGCKAIVFDDKWTIIDHSYREYNLINVGDNRFDLEPDTVWEKLQEMILEINNKTNKKIDAIAISALGDVIIPLDKSGNPVRPSIIDFDPRGKDEIKEFIAEFEEEPEMAEVMDDYSWIDMLRDAEATKAELLRDFQPLEE